MNKLWIMRSFNLYIIILTKDRFVQNLSKDGLIENTSELLHQKGFVSIYLERLLLGFTTFQSFPEHNGPQRYTAATAIAEAIDEKLRRRSKGR